MDVHTHSTLYIMHCASAFDHNRHDDQCAMRTFVIYGRVTTALGSNLVQVTNGLTLSTAIILYSCRIGNILVLALTKE